MRFVVVYDACVLYPAPLRDLLMWLANTGLFAARWSDQIQDEWVRNLAAKRPEIAEQLSRTVALMNQAVPDAVVTGHEPLIEALTLPDPDDRHVLAAAIRVGAQLIITNNLKDFPGDYLATFGIEPVHPDEFIVQQFDLHEAENHFCRSPAQGFTQAPPKVRSGIPRNIGIKWFSSHRGPLVGLRGVSLMTLLTSDS